MTPSGSADRLEDVDVLTAGIADAIREQLNRARLAAGGSDSRSSEPFGET
jgi:hypothetical protein